MRVNRISGQCFAAGYILVKCGFILRVKELIITEPIFLFCQYVGTEGGNHFVSAISVNGIKLNVFVIFIK